MGASNSASWDISRSTGWTVYVHTADVACAGTDSDVTIKLIGEHGEVSRDIRLDNFLKDDFERGQVDKFNINRKDIDTFTDHTRVVRIELWKSNAGVAADWNIDKIVVKKGDSNACYTFPVFRWIKPDIHYSFVLYDTSLPQYDQFPDQRARELEETRSEYEYFQHFKDRGCDTIHVKDLPNNELLPSDLKLQIVSTIFKDKISTKLSTFLAPEKWDSIETLKKIYDYSGNSVPEGLDDWADDVHFGLQRITGCNNELIELVKDIPVNFPVHNHLLNPFLEGMSIQQAIDQKRMFICDYKILQGIKPKQGFALCVPICLFFVDNQDKLRPVAIQLFQTPCPENPIFTPGDPTHTWTMVKMWANNADGAYHEAIPHLGGTHLLMEGVLVAAHRTMSRSHPVWKMLAPHFLYLLAINNRAIMRLVKPGELLDTLINIGANGILQVANRSYVEWRMDVQGTLPENLKRRGVDDPDILPGYHFRDDGLLVFDAIRTYVDEYVAVYYDDAVLQADTEVQAWARDLVSSPGDVQPGVGLKGVPGNGELTTTSQLCQILTSVIWLCSAGHAAANFKQYKQYGFPPNCPLYLVGTPPQSKSVNVTEEDILASLPSRRNTLETMHTVKLLSVQRTKPLGDFEVQYVCDPPALEVQERFRQKLKDVSATIKHRNLRRSNPYTTLDPDNIPNSISN